MSADIFPAVKLVTADTYLFPNVQRYKIRDYSFIDEIV